jgi:hypothetical protein
VILDSAETWYQLLAGHCPGTGRTSGIAPLDITGSHGRQDPQTNFIDK